MRLDRRYLDAQVRRDLQRKMVFVAGPRQVGKTTLATRLPGAARGYLNWDVAADRDRILRGELPPSRLSATGRKDYISPDGIRVAPAAALLTTLV